MAACWGAVSVEIRRWPGLYAEVARMRRSQCAACRDEGGSFMADVDHGELAGASGHQTGQETRAFWPYRWWRIVDFKIGIVPLPIYLALLVLITGFVLSGKVPSDILMGI